MKRARTILAVVLALVMVLSVLPASFADEAKLPEKVERLNKLGDQSKVTKTGKDLKPLDERLKTVEELDPETDVTVIVVFDEPALSDTYSAEEIRAKKAEAVQNRLSGEHDTFFKSLSFEAKRLYDYTALINGMSIVTAYKNIAQIEKMSGVSRVYVANSYNAPVVQKPTQMNANLITGAAAMQNVEYKGDGMVVAVLDTGLNLGHEAFQDYGLLENPAFTEEYVASVETTVPGKYVSNKVPFSYDYYDGDDDVTDYNGHGSHVSGTIAGFVLDPDGAIKFSGAAPAAQLVFMKIFADQAAGTNSGIYMAALEDCFLLGVDAINMSIGAPGGFVYDAELEGEFGNVYKKLDQAGIVVCISAGNEYSMAYNNGNFSGQEWVLADYADYAEVASPSTYAGNLSIASMENFSYPSAAISYNGENFPYVDNCDDGEHGWLDAFEGKTIELVDCGKGAPEEIPAEVAGKVALVVRGDLSFSEKNANVAAAGAIGMILFNNTTGSIGMLIDPYYVPAISIQQDAGLTIQAGLEADNTVTVPKGIVNVDNPSAWLMSTFSSWGCTPNLELKPSLTAPGGMIYSSVAGAPDAYEVYSGTSMASPNACGSFALLLEYLKDTQPTLSKAQRAELAEDLAQSTSWIPQDADGYLYSPRKTGAGIIDLEAAISTPVYITDPVVNLYDDPEKTGVYTIRYTAYNLTDSDQEYSAFAIGLYDYVVQGYNTLTSDYLFDGQGMTVEGDTEITIPANGKFDGKIKLTLDDETKATFDETFANGNYVEGYIAFNAASEENAGINVPVNVGTLGDANLDGKVTAADAAEILRAIVGLTELDEEAQAMADVNEDGDVTAADASFILRAIVGLETLPSIIEQQEAESAPEIHLTFMGFYGDWTQAPVLDKIWANSEDYLFYLGVLNVMYPQYAAAGYLPTDLFDAMEVNIKLHNMYGGMAASQGLYTYFGTNPMTTLTSNADVAADAWYDVAMNYNPLHNAISNGTADAFSVVDWMYVEPIQLRNAKHLIMTVSDAETGEVYYVDDTEFLGKAYFDKDNQVWGPRGSFYWDGINMNEESEGYGDYVPNGTICLVTWETMIDYPGAELHKEYEYQLIVDTESPIITGVEFAEEQVEATEEGEEPTAKKTVTVNFDDNGSGVAFVDAYYMNEALEAVDLGYAVGTDTEAFAIDLSELPEDITYITLDAMDYATNWPDYTLNVKTGAVEQNVYAIGSVQFADDKIFNDKTALGEKLAVEGIVTEVYNDVVYIESAQPTTTDPGYGIAINLADKEQLAEISVGDVWVFFGELDNYYGCPRLDKAEATENLYKNEYIAEDAWDPGDELWYIPETIFNLTDIQTDPSRFVGGVYFLSDLKIIGITEIGDGTRTVSVTDGKSAIDIVATYALEDANVGDYVVAAFVLIFDQGVPQFRVLCDDSLFWIESY